MAKSVFYVDEKPLSCADACLGYYLKVLRTVLC